MKREYPKCALDAHVRSTKLTSTNPTSQRTTMSQSCVVQLLLLLLSISYCESFGVLSYHRRYATIQRKEESCFRLSAEAEDAPAAGDTPPTDAKEEQIGNLVADDEWMGLSMELTELVRVAVVEDIKKNTRDFLGKEEYKVGDLSKELDARVKDEVARFRDKDEYELGDLTMALDKMSKDLTCELTGKDEYEAGDLSTELDKRVKSAVADFCGKDEYQVGDLSREIDRRVKERVAEFTGKGEYEFGDVAREVESRRREWVNDFLGKEAADNYQFGDITKKAISNLTGKDDYQFGDITKKFMGDIFGKRKRGGD